MTKKNVHVVPSGKEWAVKQAGNSKASAKTDTQKQAIDKAIPIAKKNQTSVVIHGRDGKIRDADSYGDESPAKDTKH